MNSQTGTLGKYILPVQGVWRWVKEYGRPGKNWHGNITDWTGKNMIEAELAMLKNGVKTTNGTPDGYGTDEDILT